MYRNLNDNELIYMINENNEEIFNVLYQKYKPLMFKMSKKFLSLFRKYGYEMDDILQICYYSLYKASCYYDESNNSLFYSYFKRILYNSLVNEMRINSSLKKEVLNNALSYDILIPNTNMSYKELIGKKIKYDYEYSDNYLLFKSSLPFLESCIFELYMNGFSFKEISILLDEKIEVIYSSFNEIKKDALTYKSLFFSENMIY